VHWPVPVPVELVTGRDAPGATVTWPFWVAPVTRVSPVVTLSWALWVPVMVVVQVTVAGLTVWASGPEGLP
jgi:hypothetical protein